MKSGKSKYIPVAVAVDVIVFTIANGELSVLCIKRPRAPFKGFWALPGGFLKNGETIQQAALRVLKDKAGVADVYVEQLYTFDTSGRDPRGHIPTVAYYALVPHSQIRFNEGQEIQEPTLWPIYPVRSPVYRTGRREDSSHTGSLGDRQRTSVSNGIRRLPRLAFDHKNILAYGIKRLRAKLEYTNVVFSLLPPLFTLNELQKVYETIFGSRMDKRNFRKKFLSLGLIRPTSKMFAGVRQRPARLYEFISRHPMELEKFF